MPVNIFPRRNDPSESMDAAYAPDRDVAYIVPAIVDQFVPAMLERSRIPAWLKKHIDANGLTEADLQRAVDVFQDSMRLCSDPTVPNMQDALKAGGFWDLPDAQKIPPLMVFALVMISVYTEGVRFAMRGAAPHKIVVVSDAMKDAFAAGVEVQKKDPLFGKFLRTMRGGK